MKKSNNSIIFNINDIEFIKIDINSTLQNIGRYDQVTVIYINQQINKKYILDSRTCIIDILTMLQNRIKKALSKNLVLHYSITKNIGYLWNLETGYMRDKRHKKPDLFFKLSEDGLKVWIGNQYILWCTPGNQIPNLISWIYEKNEQFFFEVSSNYPPDYRWDQMKLKDAKKDPNFKTFKQFMASYQPLVVTTIERSVLEQWRDQLQYLIPLIEANDSKYFIKEAHKES